MQTRTLILIVICLLTLLFLNGGQARADNGYLLSEQVVAGGGGSLVGGSYQLTGTISQPEAGHEFSAGSYVFHGGFWHAGGNPTLAGIKVFLPFLVK